jgi:branched-subunit amino acid ABC-type transport system permease component
MDVQLVADGVAAGLVIALLGVGFSVFFSGNQFFSFSYGASYAWGAYAGFFAAGWMSYPLAAACGIAVAALLGATLEGLVYRPLRQRGHDRQVLMLASMGVYIVLQNTISMVFGDQTRVVALFRAGAGRELLGARVAPAQWLMAACSVLAIAGVTASVFATSWGRNLRAVASDSALARIVGVPVERHALVAALVGGGLAGLGGILVSLDTGLVPTMGFQALLLAIVAWMAGGAGVLTGVAAAGLALGLLQHMSAEFLPTIWQDGVVYAVFLTFLIIRPYGISGYAVRRATV